MPVYLHKVPFFIFHRFSTEDSNLYGIYTESLYFNVPVHGDVSGAKFQDVFFNGQGFCRSMGNMKQSGCSC